jgi:hypothetical protein
LVYELAIVRADYKRRSPEVVLRTPSSTEALK